MTRGRCIAEIAREAWLVTTFQKTKMHQWNKDRHS